VDVSTTSWAEMAFAHIPEGDFVMGSAENDSLASEDEHPQHIVPMDYGYWTARTPVTNEQFGGFVRADGYVSSAEKEGWAFVFDSTIEKREKTPGASWRHPTGPTSNADEMRNHPVVSVSWFDALAYCGWLNEIHGVEMPDGLRFRLPNEAEWEKAARGPDGRVYPWGDQFEGTFCNHIGSVGRATIPVGTLSRESDSVYGAVEMSGNTWDWTTTLWGNDRDDALFAYPYDPTDGREDLSAGDDFFRIIRGGSFKNEPQACRSACRDLDQPGWFLNNLGLRLVAAPQS